MFGIMQHLDVVICRDGNDAIAQGHVYSAENGFTAVEIEKAVVVQNGTERGNSTVDLIFRDQQGNKYVVMLTGNLLKSIPV